MIMTPEEKYHDLYEQMYDLCKEQGWGDPFSMQDQEKSIWQVY